MADKTDANDPPVSIGAPVNHQVYKMEKGQLWRQYIIAGIANIAIASAGYSMSWTSWVSLKRENKHNTGSLLELQVPTEVTIDQIIWIRSLLPAGAIFGSFVGGFIASMCGRKWGLLSTTIPHLAGWMVIADATSVEIICAGRICLGVAVGMLFTISPMYCAEIATDEARDALGLYLQKFIALGFLLSTPIMIWYPIPFSTLAYVGAGIVALFALAFICMPESPTYYLIKNKRDSAAACLARIRGKSRAGVQAELDKMQADVTKAQSKSATIAANFKAFYISCALVSFQQLSGISAVLFYMRDIFDVYFKAFDEVKFSPDLSTLIVGAIHVVAAFIAPLLVGLLGRRLLLLVSSCGTAVSLGLLGMFFIQAAEQSPIAENHSTFPTQALVLFIVMYCWGLGPLPWVVMSDLFPIRVKASSLATAYCWGLAFLITRFFNPKGDAYWIGLAFLISAVLCVISFFFTLFLVPETKGKSLQEIQDMLAGKSSKSEKV